ncbi:putative YphP/YqiW family bacilliredoxin [Scopulibacillus darangshiensis]|uniref:Putative YphP/YqiW family bacilliredoxin n=1 Tax=Scopulibacillus darangshiensis TaxID=442528 RepID=A0A4R2P9S8_9BACL|nr:BrxA/BrxB family bacilliredoxin [Scopulibacillus darangshiensis]TCP31810.1 putative YphP/YqiW family bacilliredoxin [Scopulibacillus darangshiensis]
MGMDFDIFMNDVVQTARKEITTAGYKELRTPEEVDDVMKKEGTTFVMINSVCGCAGGVARPAAAYAANCYSKPDQLVTVFAGQDKDATERAREYFTGYPPSSPSFALLNDGKIVKMVERHEIEGFEPMEVATKIEKLFDEHCS